jgi:peptide subunit release factor 1 (eRF1)
LKSETYKNIFYVYKYIYMETIEKLRTVKSAIGGTSLVTLYIEHLKSMWLFKDHVIKEIKTASNIKDKNVSKAVINALKMIQHKLNMLKVVPDNGIVLVSGEFKLDESYV